MTALEQAREALEAARDCILIDRTALADCHMDPVTNEVDADGRDGVADYDAVLALIGGALATLSAQEVPQAADAGVWEVARYGYFKDDTFIEVSVEDEDVFGCRWVGGLRDAELARAVLKLTAAPAAPKQEAWKCEAVTADFSDGTITLHVKAPDWHVAAGEYLLIPPAATQD